MAVLQAQNARLNRVLQSEQEERELTSQQTRGPAAAAPAPAAELRVSAAGTKEADRRREAGARGIE